MSTAPGRGRVRAAATPERITEARREFVRIGVDELAGAAIGDITALTEG